jgi:hypothetical protein
MHAIVIKTEILDHYPWVTMNLFKGFEEAKMNRLKNILTAVTSRLPVPWCHDAAVEERKIFGEDLWPYGI